jgi:phosphoribosylanthranilate isomerase
MFQIKICGITTANDAVMASQAGADALGLNFFPKSPRFLAPDRAAAVASAVPAGVLKVGLFVNASAQDICERFDRLGLDLIQLHGDESPEFHVKLGGRPVMRAFRVDTAGLRPIEQYLARCRQLDVLPQMVLLDAQVQGAYGGTGQVADWETVKRYSLDHPRLALAGGLTPANVAEAIRTVRPAAVDTASGVEASPGRKDASLVQAFIQAARAAFNA